MRKLIAVLQAMGLWPRAKPDARSDAIVFDDASSVDVYHSYTPSRGVRDRRLGRGHVDPPRTCKACNPPPNPGVPSKLNAPRPGRATLTDRELLIRCDSLLSIIRYRELAGLTSVTLHELDGLLPKLRARTDELTTRKGANPR